MSEPDDDEAVAEQWCAVMREQAVHYLSTQKASHGEVGEWPGWHLAPYVSVWAVESLVKPGSLGWWVVTGDLPTDYVSADVIKYPRDALKAFADRWQAYAGAVRAGSEPGGFELGGLREDSETMLPLLASRAEALAEWARDDDLWEGL